jgi:hypothetical protein
MTQIADNAQRFSSMDLMTLSHGQLVDLSSSSSASSIPWLVEFRSVHNIPGYLTRYERWLVYQRICEQQQEGWIPYNFHLKQDDLKDKTFNAVSGKWEAPLRWQPAPHGLPYSKVRTFKLLGVEGKSDIELDQMKFVPMLLQASGREELIGEPRVTPIRGFLEKEGEVTLMENGEKEVVKIIMTKEVNEQLSLVNVEKVGETIGSRQMTSGVCLFEGLRTIINYQDFDRPLFATAMQNGRGFLQFVFYAEVYESDKIKTNLAYLKLAPGNRRTFVSIKTIVADGTLLPPLWGPFFRGGVWTKFGPQFMELMAHQHMRVFIAGRKELNGQVVYILAPVPDRIQPVIAQQSNLTSSCALLPRMVVDENVLKTRIRKIAVIDVEYIQVERQGGSQWICPMGAVWYGEISGQGLSLQSSKLFVDTSYIQPDEFQRFKKCANVRWLAGQIAMDQSTGATINGGMPGLRRFVYGLRENGYIVLSKGPRVEAIVLSDFGVSTPLPPGHCNAGRSTIIETDGIGEYCEVKAVDHNYAGLPVRVYDLKGSKIEHLRNIYFDRFNFEDFLTMYETGAKSRDHHPFYDVKIFAHHYLANAFFRPYYVIHKYDYEDLHLFYRSVLWNTPYAFDKLFEQKRDPKFLLSYEYGTSFPVRVNGGVTLPPRDPFEGNAPVLVLPAVSVASQASNRSDGMDLSQ